MLLDLHLIIRFEIQFFLEDAFALLKGIGQSHTKPCTRTWPGANEEASGVFDSVNDRELLLPLPLLLQMNEGFLGDRAAILTDAGGCPKFACIRPLPRSTPNHYLGGFMNIITLSLVW